MYEQGQGKEPLVMLRLFLPTPVSSRPAWSAIMEMMYEGGVP